MVRRPALACALAIHVVGPVNQSSFPPMDRPSNVGVRSRTQSAPGKAQSRPAQHDGLAQHDGMRTATLHFTSTVVRGRPSPHRVCKLEKYEACLERLGPPTALFVEHQGASSTRRCHAQTAAPPCLQCTCAVEKLVVTYVDRQLLHPLPNNIPLAQATRGCSGATLPSARPLGNKLGPLPCITYS